MADTPQQQFEQKVIISLETALKGVQGALNALKDMEKLAGKAADSTEMLAEIEGDLGKQLASTTEQVNKQNKSLSAGKRIQKGLYETTRGLGGIALKAFGVAAAAAGAYLFETKRIGKSMLELQTQSLGAAGALDRLGSSYSNFAGSAGSAVVSLQDVAQSLAKFQSQGIAEMAAGMNSEFKDGFVGMQDTLTKVLGKSGGASAMESFYKSMGSDFSTFRKSMESDLRVLTKKFKDARDSGDKPGSLKALDALKNRIKELRLYTSDAGLAAQQVVNNLETLGGAIKGKNPTTAGLIAMHEALGLVGTMMETFSNKMLVTFGNDTSKIVDALREKIVNLGLDTKGIESYVDGILDKFRAWGGIDKLIVKMNKTIDKTWEFLKKAAAAAADFITWFTKSGGAKAIVGLMKLVAKSVAVLAKMFIEASDGAKMLVIAALAISFNPGLMMGLTSLVGGLKDAFVWANKTAAATRAMNVASIASGNLPTAGRAIGAKTTGVAIGGAMTVAGHLGGRAAAKAAGFDEHGAVSKFAGAGSAAAGGAMAGAMFGPGGAAIGASIAAIGSLFVSGLQDVYDDMKETIKAEKALNNMKKSSKEMTIQLEKTARAMDDVAVSRLQKLEAIGKDIIAQKNRVGDQELSGDISEAEADDMLKVLDKQLNDVMGKKRKLGGYEIAATASIDASFAKKIQEQEKLRSAAMEKAKAGGAAGASELAATGELKTYSDTIKALEAAGREQTVINRLLEERQEILSKKGSEGIDDKTLSKNFQKVQDNIKKHTGKRDAATGGIPKSAEEIEKIKKELEAARDPYAEFLANFRDLSQYNVTLGGLSDSIGSLSSVLDVLGPSAKEFGVSLNEAMQVQSTRQMKESFKALEDSANNAKEAMEQMAKAEAKMLSGDEEERAQGVKDSLHWQKEYAKSLKVSVEAAKSLGQSLDTALAPLQKHVDMAKSVIGLRKLDLDISQQLYGTPALAVQAQLNLVEMQQKEKELLEQQLAIARQKHDEAKIERKSNEDIYSYKMKELELAQNIKQITADQLSQVKQLRDGYLDAVKAQAFGAGKFSKIIISQEQNLMRGLKKGATERNYLLGQYAEDSAKKAVVRFSDQGQGMIEDTSGQVMSPKGTKKFIYDSIDSISDPASQAAARQSADVFMDVSSSATKNTQDLGNMFAATTDTNTTRIVDAINADAETKVKAGATAAALRNSPAGVTALGGAAERTMRGKKNFLATYQKNARLQGSSEGSIDAMNEFQRNKKTTPKKIAPVAKPIGIVETLAPVVGKAMYDAFKGFQSGGLGGIIPGIKGGMDSSNNAAKEKQIMAETKQTNAEQMKRIKESQSGTGKDSRQRNIPTLQAYDTDAFMGHGRNRNFEKEMTSKFGRDGAGIAQQARLVQKAASFSDQIKDENTTKRKAAYEKQYARAWDNGGSGGFVQDEDITKGERVAEKVRQRRGASAHHNWKVKKGHLDKMIEAARKKQPGGMSDAQFKKMDAERAAIERSGTDAAGTTYSGKAPDRVKGLPDSVLSAGAAGPTAMGQKQQLSGVSSPNKVRQLSHGAAGNWGSKGKEVDEHLRKAGQGVLAMGAELDRQNAEQGNVTNQGYNRLMIIHPTSTA